jgi:hypothetical protein
LRLKLIACEVLYREFCHVIARSRNQVDAEFLPKGLHDRGSQAMLAELQGALDRVDPTRYEAALFGYGLCGNGLAGLTARSIPVVLPRAHDCITLFLGSRERYIDYFNANPGVYYKTTGWIERGAAKNSLDQQISFGYEELVNKYGEENAKYLYEELTKHYRQFTFIEMGVEPDGRFENRARADADQRGWAFEKIQGDLGLFQRLVDGPWDEADFLVAPPGRRIAVTHGDGIIRAEAAGN